MSTTVTYKGSTLTTADNQTRVLKTAGKYMEDDVTIVDVGSPNGDPLLYGDGNKSSKIGIGLIGQMVVGTGKATSEAGYGQAGFMSAG